MLLKTAKEYDITICLENMPMPQFSLGSPQAVLDFVKAINDDQFKICLDTGHVAIFPDLTPANVLRQMGTEVRAFHIHDNDGIRDLHKVPYNGVIDWKDFGRALRETKCKAVFSYETAISADKPLADAEVIYAYMIKTARKIIGN